MALLTHLAIFLLSCASVVLASSDTSELCPLYTSPMVYNLSKAMMRVFGYSSPSLESFRLSPENSTFVGTFNVISNDDATGKFCSTKKWLNVDLSREPPVLLESACTSNHTVEGRLKFGCKTKETWTEIRDRRCIRRQGKVIMDHLRRRYLRIQTGCRDIYNGTNHQTN